MATSIVTPRSPLIDIKTGLLTRDGFRFLDQLNTVLSDLSTALLIQTVTNGISDQAPSSNAVYDAIADAVSVLSDYLTTDDFDTAIAAYMTSANASNSFYPLAGAIAFTGPPVLPSYTVAGAPVAASYPGGLIYVSNESGGATAAYSNGSNWKRVYDAANIS